MNNFANDIQTKNIFKKNQHIKTSILHVSENKIKYIKEKNIKNEDDRYEKIIL
jgi:hypothetical protein